MQSIKEYMQKESAKTFTANGASTYNTTLNKNLDLFYLCGTGLNNNSQDDAFSHKLRRTFSEAYAEDRYLALLNLIRMRDIRNGGLGRRKNFRICLEELANLNTKETIDMLPIIATIGRWDDLLYLLSKDVPDPVKGIILELVKLQLMQDNLATFEDSSFEMSLLGKWLPNIASSNKEQRIRARLICRRLKITGKEYRALKKKLGQALNVLEQKLPSGKFDEIDYDKIPARALQMYFNTFRKKDSKRFMEYLDSLQNTDKKPKITGIYPHEIIEPVYPHCYDDDKFVFAESRWNAIERTEESNGTIVVRDGSASMGCNKGLPDRVATALAILFSEQLTGPFKDSFITFSHRPKLVDLAYCRSLKAKLDECKNCDEMTTTNLLATYKLIIDASRGITNENDYIKRVVIISDMHFDQGTSNVTTHDEAVRMFEEANIPMPEVIYWNVATDNVVFPTMNDKGVTLVSGYSKHIIDDIINNKTTTPEGFMLATLEKFEKFLIK